MKDTEKSFLIEAPDLQGLQERTPSLQTLLALHSATIQQDMITIIEVKFARSLALFYD